MMSPYQTILFMFAFLMPQLGCDSQKEAADEGGKKVPPEAPVVVAPQFAPRPATNAASQQSHATKPQRCSVHGELFGTTNGGDVKKAAALTVYLIRVDDASREFIRSAKQRHVEIETEAKLLEEPLTKKYPLVEKRYDIRDQAQKVEGERQYALQQAEFKQILDVVTPKRVELDRLVRQRLLMPALNTTTDSSGKFQIDVDQGQYVLVSDQWAVGGAKIVWVKLLNATQSDLSLSLSQKNALAGKQIDPTFSVDINTREIALAMASELGIQ